MASHWLSVTTWQPTLLKYDAIDAIGVIEPSLVDRAIADRESAG